MTRRCLGAPLRRKLLRAVAVAAPPRWCLLTGAVAPASADHREPSLRVIARNLYLGADLTPALDRPRARRPSWVRWPRSTPRTRRPTSRPRAKAIAQEIDRTGPDLVGLQEVSGWQTRRGPGRLAPSQDFLAVLQAALDARGLDYRGGLHVGQCGSSAGAPNRALCVRPRSGACQLTFTDRDVIMVNQSTRRLRWEQSAVRHLRRPTGLHPAAAQGAGAVVPPRLGLDQREVPRSPVPLCHHPPGDLGLACQDPAGAGCGVPGRSGLRAGGRSGGRRLQLRR